MGPDVAIIGGGPAGLAAALALLSEGYSVTLVERSDYTDVRVGEHLSPGAVPHLSKLGILDLVQASAHSRCPGIRSAWGAPELSDQSYIFNAYGDGFNLSRPAFDAALARQAEHRGATVLRGARLKPPEALPEGWRLTTEDNAHAFNARVLVDATGRAAWLARNLGHSPVVHDRLVGLVGFLTPSAGSIPGDHSLLIEACVDGWWYSAPLADGRLVAAYMTDVDIVSQAPGRPAEYWRKRLEVSHHTRTRTTGHTIPGDVHVRPAQSQTLATVTRPNWISIGDAAMSFDPLSSAGIAKSFEGSFHVAKAIRGLLDNRSDARIAYENSVQTAFKKYLRTRIEYYRMEQRWPDSLFWARRHAT